MSKIVSIGVAGTSTLIALDSEGRVWWVPLSAGVPHGEWLEFPNPEAMRFASEAREREKRKLAWADAQAAALPPELPPKS